MDSPPIFLFRRVCLERELCFGLNCQSGDKQERGLVELLNQKIAGFNFQNNIRIWFPEHRSSEERLSPKSVSTESGPLELKTMFCNILQLINAERKVSKR